MIQQWFLKMPDELSELLAARGTAGKPIKSDEEREELERRHEKEFLRTQGDYTEQVQQCRALCRKVRTVEQVTQCDELRT